MPVAVTAPPRPPSDGPHVVVLSSLFPSALQPGSGLFVRERAFRVGARLPLAVVAPTPWFPGQTLLRRLRPGSRPGAPRHERQRGFDVWYPRFFSLPLVLRPRLQQALAGVQRVFAVSDSLRRLALQLGVPPERTRVVGNGVDLLRFAPQPRAACRERLGLPADAPVLVTVGGLVERKGFHRVIELLPALRMRWPGLHYLVVGGPSPEGDWTARLQAQVRELGLQDCVRFTGPLEPDALAGVLSAADVFVLPTRNEGWANVLLEAMACGLPVVATDVGGNAEVVCRPELGTVVPFGDAPALEAALHEALARPWDRGALRRHAEANTWDRRIDDLEAEFLALARAGQGAAAALHEEVAR
ncbi:MAG: glycosyltransferase [Pseudomonadota bacterium]